MFDAMMPGIAIPGIFARRVNPNECLVNEDSADGIRAAIAAGMTTVSLSAAGHIRDGHDRKLRDAGAVHLAQSWSDVERFALQSFGA